MSEPNYAGNIIVVLADLPEFLRKPILQKRLMEFFSMSISEKKELINNALAAGPIIPFDKFSKLFKTWLEILTSVSEEHRATMFSNYIMEIVENPQKIVLFNLDGILEVFLSLSKSQKEIISGSVKRIVGNLNESKKKILFSIVPDKARKELGI
ncbi:MAG: hypothetical protein HY295_06590 [Thaumarchaeota archaeon]|nr:hypothetical protein [Nitrososphaerota archaeon]